MPTQVGAFFLDKKMGLCYDVYTPGGYMRRGNTMADEEKVVCTCCKTKHREEKEYQDLIRRLNRIEGQVRGVRNMVKSDRYCVDILTQVSAITAALNAFNKELLSQHIKGCVVHDIQDGRLDTVDELCATLQKLMK